MATTSAAPANAWIMDSSATHHLTSDLHNMTLAAPYAGDDSVLTRDGSGLYITHTGSITLPSNTRYLNLNNVLCFEYSEKSDFGL